MMKGQLNILNFLFFFFFPKTNFSLHIKHIEGYD